AALLARRWWAAGAALAAVAAALAVAAVAPRSSATGEERRVALVQGGGPQGTRAWHTDEREVFERHLEASEEVEGPVDLVVWPEDVVDVHDLGTSRERGELAALAEDLGATLVVGVVEDAGPRAFANYAAAFAPDGKLVDRYDKVHRVPFGEYVPLRWLVEGFAGQDLTTRDAVVGRRPAELSTPAGELAVAISWEVFFADRVREGVQDGAELVLNPTNGSSFTGTLVQAQQVATSRMRAIESDRWLLQVAPTGFSAVVDPDGTVRQRTAVSDQAVLQGTVQLRTGTTLATRLGDGPGVAVAIVALVAGWVVAHRRRDRPPSHVQHQRDRPVVDEGHAHVGAEAPGRHLDPEPT
ncbi:MAG TPA: apolipoprotein N-acyltransferase, partial [Acidimicrobiales bacterium]|nr:apolipoprotein N-acyltransferase [Acidimicrobiales bacterium]